MALLLKSRLSILGFIFWASVIGLAPTATSQAEQDSVASPLDSLSLRSIGPAYSSGRISDFAFFSGGHHDYLVATASGGLWRTRNAGTTWTPIFDNEGTYAIGVVEIAPSDEKIIWVGTGENNAQRSVAFGDGVYKSTDAGRTWQNMGLKSPAISVRSGSTPRTRTRCWWRLRDHSGQMGAIAAFTKQPTGA